MTTVNTIANLTTEQLKAYEEEYTTKIQTSFKSFDEKEFNSYYESAKNEYLFNNKTEMDIPLSVNVPSIQRRGEYEAKGKVRLTEWELEPSQICYYSGALYKYLFVESEYPNMIFE